MAAKRGAKTAENLGSLPEWNLGDLYSSPESSAFSADLKRAESKAQAFENTYKGKLEGLARGDSGGARLAEAIMAYEAIDDLIGRIMSYASLRYAADTSDPARAKFYGDAQEKMTTTSSHLLFFTLELNRIDDAVLDALTGDGPLDMGDSDSLERDAGGKPVAAFPHPALARYKPWLGDIRKERPYQLEDRIEQLFHDKSVSGRAAWNRLFDETMSSLRFDIEGESLAIEPALNRLLDPKPAVRRKAGEALARTFSNNIRLFTLITNTLAKDKAISDRWRGFKDVAASRHLANRVENEVVDALEKAAVEAFPRLSHRYYALKARWLGMDQLAHWDRNAPLPDRPERVVTWDEARDTVLSAYHGFSPAMAEIAGRFFTSGWIDAPVRPGKSPGAFSHPTVPSAHPYVLLNYQGRPRDVMTLAHELGHGVHQVLAAPQGALMAPTPLTLAETASVFGEMLTFKSLLEQAKGNKERKALLAQKVEDMINTVVRQIAFYRFERRVHTERAEGELTSGRLGEIWLDVQRESLGPAIALKPGYETFWAYIPHFIHSPFYVYAYAFGDCLVNSLYAVYENAQHGFQERYLDMLKAGGTKHHSELLKPFGLDASDPGFWRMGLSVIERMIDELESLDRAD